MIVGTDSWVFRLYDQLLVSLGVPNRPNTKQRKIWSTRTKMRIQERSKHKLKISLYMNKWDISWKLNFAFFRQKNDKKYRWKNVHFLNFEHSLALLVPRDCAIETPRWRYRANSAIILKAKFASKILWTFEVQKEKEEKMELIVHQPGKTLQFLIENDQKWPKSPK